MATRKKINYKHNSTKKYKKKYGGGPNNNGPAVSPVENKVSVIDTFIMKKFTRDEVKVIKHSGTDSSIKVSFNCKEIYDALKKSTFYNNNYLQKLGLKKEYTKSNKPHREFEKLKAEQAKYHYYIPEDRTLLTSIKEEFYTKSPTEIHAWWLAKHMHLKNINKDRTIFSKISIKDYLLNDIKSGSETILSVITNSLINALTHFINSYIKYGFQIYEPYSVDYKSIEIDFVNALLISLDNLYTDGATYKELYDFIINYGSWYDNRVAGRLFLRTKNGKTDATEILEKLLKTQTFFLPMGSGLAYCKSIYLYSAPILYFSIVNDIGHGNLYTPFLNIVHDIEHNSNLLDTYMTGDGNYFTQDKQIPQYECVTKLLQEIYNIEEQHITFNDVKISKDHICYIIFSLLHEFNYLSGFNNSCNKQILAVIQYKKTIVPNSFYVDILNINYIITNIDKILDAHRNPKTPPGNTFHIYPTFIELDNITEATKKHIYGNIYNANKSNAIDTAAILKDEKEYPDGYYIGNYNHIKKISKTEFIAILHYIQSIVNTIYTDDTLKKLFPQTIYGYTAMDIIESKNMVEENCDYITGYY